MQYLKEDVKERILSSALIEFKNHGYLDASMRDIAQGANIASGNIYRYFKNKEALFNELIDPVYTKIINYISQIQNEFNNSDNSKKEDSLSYINDIYNKIIELFKIYSVELTIISNTNKSKGSKYENVKEDLILLVNNILVECLSKNKKEDENNKELIYILSSTLVEGVSIVLREHEDGETVKFLINKLISVFFADINSRV